MKIRSLCFLAAALCLCAAAHSTAHALGLGAYFTGAGGRGAWFTPEGNEMGWRSYGQFGGGLVLDTCVARQRLFNYRLALGYDRYSSENEIYGEDAGTVSFGMNRFSMYHTLGFGLLSTEQLRLWCGPQLGVCCSFGSGTGTTYYYFMNYTTATGHELDYVMYGASLGLTLGLNFNLGKSLTLYVETGMRYTVNYARGSGTGYMGIMSAIARMNERMEMVVHGYEGYGSVGVMYRIGDVYSRL
jgi:hypothetical protein